MSNDADRLARIESRLVQLMLYIGMDPYGKNPKGGFIDTIQTPTGESGCSSGRDTETRDPSPDWTALDEPTYQRRSRDNIVARAISITKEVCFGSGGSSGSTPASPR